MMLALCCQQAALIHKKHHLDGTVDSCGLGLGLVLRCLQSENGRGIQKRLFEQELSGKGLTL